MNGTMHRLSCAAALLTFYAGALCAQAPAAPTASYDANSHVFRIDGGNVTYAFGVTANGLLASVYWGPRLQPGDPLPRPRHLERAFELNDTPQEFTGFGGGVTSEPALKITFPDGNRDLVLQYASHHIEPGAIDLTLRDVQRDVFVVLHYSIDADTGILARSATITNKTGAPFTIEQVASAEWELPRSTDYQLRYLGGRWGGEDQVQQHAIAPGATVIESRRGFTGHQFAPWFAVAKNSSVSETDGEIWFGSLAWSGNWRISVAQDAYQQVHIVGGFNPFDFSYPLAAGESLTTPVFYGGIAQHGYEEVSRLESQFQRMKILPQAPHPHVRPVLYNSWEATEFNVSLQTQSVLADKAASIGVERFVMDDGWFSTRKKDNAGLGDWYPDPDKFPHGLKPLIDHVHSLGMDFGLWIEPEMVDENSDLYRAHPDWIIHFTGRPRTQTRTQFVLNLALPEVRAYIISVLDKLLSENDIAFIKWDANRIWSEPGWPQAPLDEQKSLYVKYIQNYYSILREIRAKHPKVEFESCSGGGGRIDLGVMGLTDEVWTSDNTDPFDRLLIQDGFTYAYTPLVMMAWVTDSPNWYNHRSTSLAYRFISSMQGSLGLGADLNKWTPEDFATAKRLIAEYKNIRATVQQGSLYRLASPRDHSNFSATESVASDGRQAVVFAFLRSQQMQYPAPVVFPRGLKEDAQYTVRTISGTLEAGTPERASGAYWMHHGLSFRMQADFDAAAAEFTRQ